MKIYPIAATFLCLIGLSFILCLLSENLIKAQAHMMVSKGFLKAGYEYIIVDDCWLSHERDHNGELQPDPERFPSGMKALGDYVSYRISSIV